MGLLDRLKRLVVLGPDPLDCILRVLHLVSRDAHHEEAEIVDWTTCDCRVRFGLNEPFRAFSSGLKARAKLSAVGGS